MENEDQLFQNIATANEKEKPERFLELCTAAIESFDPATFREEAVGHVICRATVANAEIWDNVLFDDIQDLACEMEIPRESSFGIHMPLDEKWTEDRANTFKKEQFEKLIALITKAKAKLSSEKNK